MTAVARLATVLALVACAACSDKSGSPDQPAVDGDSGDGTSCGATLPKTCPTAPSYAATVAPLIQRTCSNGCHSAGGIAADRDFTTYHDVARLETTELVQLYSCQMPPADAGADAALSLEERETIMQWFICGYPNN